MVSYRRQRYVLRFAAGATLLALGLFAQALPVCGAETIDADQWLITADRVVRYEDPPAVIAQGNVILEKKEASTSRKRSPSAKWDGLLGADAGKPGKAKTTMITATIIKADWVAYDMTLGRARARGNLDINIKGDRLKAESGVVNLKDSTGTFDNATVIRKELQLHLEGRTIEKTGDLTYHIEDGWVITCKLKDGQKPPWSVASSDTTITDGGYAVLKNAVFRVKDVPIFWSPYLILPAKHERQTGFLFPALSTSSRDGFGFETPFFINLSPWADLTLYPRYMHERGLMLGTEFRYASDEKSKGMFIFHYLNDDLSDPNNPDYADYRRSGGYNHGNEERYWLRGKADQNFGEWVTRLDIDYVSDRDYLREFDIGSTDFDDNDRRFSRSFGRGFEDERDNYRENTLNVLRSFHDGTALLGEVMLINDVSRTKYTDDRPSQPWKLPSLSYVGLKPLDEEGEGFFSLFDFSWNTNYVSYTRDKGMDAQRIDLSPEVAMRLPLGRYLDGLLKGGLRETWYFIDHGNARDWRNRDDTANRLLAHFTGEIGTTLYREFGSYADGESGVSHTVRPFVQYEHIDITDTDVLPIFDETDDIEESNTVYYGIHNFLSIFSSDKKGRMSERELAFLRIRQGYDLSDDAGDRPWTPVEIKTGLYPVPGMRVYYKTNWDVHGEGFLNHTLEAGYRSRKGDSFSVDYSANEVKNTESITGRLLYKLPYNLAVGYYLERSIHRQLTLEEQVRLLYQPACWSVELATKHTPGDKAFMVIFRLANIGFPFSFDF